MPIRQAKTGAQRPENGTAVKSLRDLVLAILSMASIRGTKRVPLTQFYSAFAAVVERHGNMFPPMHFARNSYSVYSKRLDEAVQNLVGYSISLPNPRLQYLELDKSAAERHLSRLQDRYGARTIRNLNPIVNEFLDRVKTRVDRPR